VYPTETLFRPRGTFLRPDHLVIVCGTPGYLDILDYLIRDVTRHGTLLLQTLTVEVLGAPDQITRGPLRTWLDAKDGSLMSNSQHTPDFKPSSTQTEKIH